MEPTTNTIDTTNPVAPQTGAPVMAAPGARPQGRDNRDPRGGFQKNPRKQGPRREPRAKPEFDQKIISIRRVTRVVTGGRRFAFSVSMVAGDKKGRVGVGIGKAGDTSLAIDKALRNAKKHMITLKLTKEMSLPHDVEAKYCGSVVKIMPAPGKGIIAGSSVRSVLELAGVKNAGAKIFSRSKNQLNNAKAAIDALSKLKARKSSGKVAEEVKA